uniref:Uncharacterized protein n=1 Tax=Picea sitchensis TaxID=3332 RepID=A9NRN7_PICSI|nr:unknown [Picea sitchensis]
MYREGEEVEWSIRRPRLVSHLSLLLILAYCFCCGDAILAYCFCCGDAR